MGSVLRVSRQRPPGDRGLSCRGATGARAGGWVGGKLMDTLKGCNADTCSTIGFFIGGTWDSCIAEESRFQIGRAHV